MSPPPGIEELSPARVAARLSTIRYGRSLDVRAETGSTNDDAREAAAEGAPDGHVVVADRQRAGRGARGRSWDSPGGTDLYVSIVARVPLSPARLPPLTLAVGLGVAEAVRASAPDADVDIKWPNDVRLGGRKCAGILIETVSSGGRIESAVIGIGLDVNRREFDPGLEASSLALAIGRSLDRADVLAAVLGRVEAEVDRFVARGPGDVVARVAPRLAWRGERVRVDELEGELLGLAADGALALRIDGETRTVRAGTLRRA